MNSPSNHSWAPLPNDVQELLRQIAAPPRLVAHLTLVHDIALKLTSWLRATFPTFQFDREAVLFGAAMHDAGKAVFYSELDESGRQHEQKGVELLLELGVPPERARFAYTHNNWGDVEDVTPEDLLVALSDKSWKGKRVDELEEKLTVSISAAAGKPQWECFAELDNFLTEIAAGADERLAWQRSFSSAKPKSEN